MLTEAQVQRLQADVAKRGASRLPTVFRALADETRFCIFSLLMERHDLCVSELARACKVTTAAASYQLRILALAGLVRRARTGKTVCYLLRDDEPVVELIRSLITNKNK